jgi:anhydro-N-acetylmuramic acid kinase
LIVAGVMSGTSADGVDVAFIKIVGRGFHTRLHLIAHEHFSYPRVVRQTILDVINATASVADLARLNFLLGELYADAVNRARKHARIKSLDLVGCHGQTIYHQGEARAFLGRRIATTWQTGEAAIIAARVRAPVVSDFRVADMAAGGKGAPLVPFLDYLLFRHRRRGRVVQNLGGIGNLTAIPPNASPDQVIAFDTGPSNMVIDGVTERLFKRPFDRDGRLASQGKVIARVLDWAMQVPYFARKPPKTAGREEFGREFVAEFLRRCGRARKQDMVATATALTARSIGDALRRFVVPRQASRYRDYFVSGGGTRNPTLMRMISGEVEPLGLSVGSTDETGLPSEAKEAVAFAVLAHQTWQREPSNIPSATGANRPAILGKISYV